MLRCTSMYLNTLLDQLPSCMGWHQKQPAHALTRLSLHQDLPMPLTKICLYLSPRSAYTSHQDLPIPLTKICLYLSPRSAYTSHQDLSMPLTKMCLCLSPRSAYACRGYL